MKKIPLIFLFQAGLMSFVIAQSSKPEILPDYINSRTEESFPLVSGNNEMFFVRTNHHQNRGGIYGGQDIWIAKKSQSSTWENPEKAGKILNTTGNNAVVGISADNTRIYLLNSYARRDGSVTGISFCTRTTDSWTEPELLKGLPEWENDSRIVSAYMAPTEDLILLSVANESSAGGFDLFVTRKQDGAWSAYRNLGININSGGDEITPFITSDLRFVLFASNGQVGYGDYDVYVSENLDGDFHDMTPAVNLGKYINGDGFDAYPAYSDSVLYFCSNRDSRYSDIYAYRIDLANVVENNYYHLVVANDSTGDFSTLKKYNIIDCHEDKTVTVTESIDTTVIVHDAELFEPQPIYFDYASSFIRSEYFSILDRVIAALQSDPTVKVLLTGHTDNTGTDDLNARLSMDRAEKVSKYLQANGIAKNRITYKGYGSSQPIASNETTSGRDKNRRVEIQIFIE